MTRVSIGLRVVFGAAAVIAAASLAGCSAPDERLESARANCLRMAEEALPNGMVDPEDSTRVFDAKEVCRRLESGMNPESFKRGYNDSAFLKQEGEIWSKHNRQP